MSYSGAKKICENLKNGGLKQSWVRGLREGDRGGYTDDIPAISKKEKEKIIASAKKVCPEGWKVDFKDELNGWQSEDKYNVWFVKGKEALHVTVVDGEPLAVGVFRSFNGNTDKADTYFHGKESLEKALDFLKSGLNEDLRESTEGVNETLIDSMRKCLELVEKKFRCWKKERSSDPDEVSYALTFKPDDIKGTLIKSLEAYVDFTASQKQWYLKIKVSADKCVVTYEGNPHPFDWVMSESYLDSNISKAIEFWGKRYDNMAREYGWPSRD